MKIILKFHPSERCELTLPEEHNVTNPVSHFQINQWGYAIDIYELYFDENLAIGCGHTCFPRASCLGYHKKDIEFVAIYQDQIIKGNVLVYFSAHSNEGKFYRLKDCQRDNDDIVVYVALNSHALYPDSGIHPRYFCLANDHTSHYGVTVVPNFVEGRLRTKNPPAPFKIS